MATIVQVHNVKDIHNIINYLYEEFLKDKNIEIDDSFVWRIEGLLYGKMFRSDSDCLPGLKDRYSNGEILAIIKKRSSSIKDKWNDLYVEKALQNGEDYNDHDYKIDLIDSIVEAMSQYSNNLFYSFKPK